MLKKLFSYAIIGTLLFASVAYATDIIVDEVITPSVTTDKLILKGDVDSTYTDIDWDLKDNHANAISFDTAGKASILNIVTTNSAEGVNMSGFLDVTGWLKTQSYIDLKEIAAPANPAADTGRFYTADATGTTKLYFKDSAGTTYDLLAWSTVTTFLGLTDTPAGYVTPTAVYRVNAAGNAIEESGLSFTGTNAGTLDFGAVGKTLTVSETATIDQDLQQSATPMFANVDLSNGGGLRTNTTAGNTLLLQAYNNTSSSYTTFATLTANLAPSFDVSGDTTIGSAYIYRAGGTDIAVADGGTGLGSYTDGQLLIGNTTGNTLAAATLTGTTNQITVTNGASTITLSTPQDIHSAATPTFAGLGLGTGNLTLTGDIATTANRVTHGYFTDLTVTNAIAGSITGNAATVTTITGLAPDTATTAAAQANITSLGTLTSLAVSGTITGGDDLMLDKTGSDVNSPALVLRGDAGGNEVESSIQTVQHANPYLRISVDNDSTAGTLIPVLDIYDTLLSFSTDNTVDIGASGANRPKDVYVAGAITATSFTGAISTAAQANITSLGTLTSLTVSGAYTGSGKVVNTPKATQTLAAAAAIDVSDAKWIQVKGDGGAVTLTSTPTIAAGTNGQEVCLLGADDTNTLKVQDKAQLAGSNLRLSQATDMTLGLGDSLCLLYSTVAGEWVEISRADV